MGRSNFFIGEERLKLAVEGKIAQLVSNLRHDTAVAYGVPCLRCLLYEEAHRFLYEEMQSPLCSAYFKILMRVRRHTDVYRLYVSLRNHLGAVREDQGITRLRSLPRTSHIPVADGHEF